MTTNEEAMTHKQKAAEAQAAAAKVWNVLVAADATQAVDFLNLAPAQGAGEAFASNRADGQVDVYYFL